MSGIIIEKYMTKIRNMNGKEYLFGVISYGIASTISGRKPSSIMTLRRENGELNVLWERYKYSVFNTYKLNFLEIKKTKDSVIILFYNVDKMEQVVYEEYNMGFLSRFGYSCEFDLMDNLLLLKDRFTIGCPHEIGIFLGFPLKDVIGFMGKSHKKCLMNGYWKVYDNIESAKKIFMDYDIDRYNIAKNVVDGTLPSMLMNAL
jgi:hypothetical protein